MPSSNPAPEAPLPGDATVTISVNGRPVSAAAGQTVAGALWQAGVRTFRHTRKSGEPRGLFCGMGACYDCRLTVDRVAYVRACLTPVRPGMRIETGDGEAGRWGEEAREERKEDAGNAALSSQQVELAVVGAGPAGLEAALAAAAAGVQVVLIDSHSQPGGQYYKQASPVSTATPATPRQQEADALFQRLRASPVQRLADTLVWGAFSEEDGWLLTLQGASAPQRLHAQALILAPGAYDRPIAFPGWTLPGVLTAGAAQVLLKTQGVAPGNRVVLAGSGPLLWLLAADLVQADVHVVAVLEGVSLPALRRLQHLPAVWGQWTRLREGWAAWRVLQRARVPVRFGWAMTAARGDQQVEAVEIARLDDHWRPIPGATETLAADALILGYGFLPSTQLTRLLGCKHVYLPEQGGWVPRRDEFMQTSQKGVYAVGDGAGVGGAALARLEGRLAGLASALHLGKLDPQHFASSHRQLRPLLRREQRFARLLGHLFTPAPGLYASTPPNTLLCRCEEVTLADIRAAQASGCRTLNEIKGLTRAGMGDCQGRMCGELLAQALVDSRLSAPARAQRLAALGMLSVRPPIHPLTLAELAQDYP